MPRSKFVPLILAVVFALAVLAQPATAFHKPVTSPGQSGNNPGHGGTPPGQAKKKDKDKDKDKEQAEGKENCSSHGAKAKIRWLTEKHEITDALLEEGEAILMFQVTKDIKNAGAWLTPSLSPYLEGEPAGFAELLAGAQEPYKITLRIKEGVELTKTIGGTLHIVDLRGDGVKGATYSRPLGIHVKPPTDDGGEAPVPDEDGEDTDIVLTNSADYLEGPIAPLEIVTIFGLKIGPPQVVALELNEEGNLSDYVADVQVLFDGVAAPIIAVSENQINVVVPYSVAGKSQVEVIVTYKDKVIAGFMVDVVDAAPAIFTMHGLGHGYAAAYDQQGKIIGPDNPAVPGTPITFFGTGLGLWKHDFQNGAIVTAGDLPVPKKEVKVEIGGIEAKILYVGGAPGMVNAVVQFNVIIPEGLTPGIHKLVAYSGGHPSKAEVLIPVAEPADEGE